MAKYEVAAERVDRLVEALEIPETYYEQAIERAKSISSWLTRPESMVLGYRPTVFPQGSFRLGTVVRPISKMDEYDLDLVCQLSSLSKETVSQERLKQLVGFELKAYAAAYRISKPVVESKRCWRLEYSDNIGFHIDCLPCVPEDCQTVRQLVIQGVGPDYAQFAVAITCTEHRGYSIICSDWPSSSPAGFAKWFEHRIGKPGDEARNRLLREHRFSSIDEIPSYALRSPLQRSIQLMKRHRDVMFSGDLDLRPISMIISAVAGQAYQGEPDVWEATIGILERIPNFIRGSIPRVPNPVNLKEDFADKWQSNPALERNWHLWRAKALRDFHRLAQEDLLEQSPDFIQKSFAVSTLTAANPTRKVAVSKFVDRSEVGVRPWGELSIE